jgi:hypothetical protein
MVMGLCGARIDDAIGADERQALLSLSWRVQSASVYDPILSASPGDQLETQNGTTTVLTRQE